MIYFIKRKQFSHSNLKHDAIQSSLFIKCFYKSKLITFPLECRHRNGNKNTGESFLAMKCKEKPLMVWCF